MKQAPYSPTGIGLGVSIRLILLSFIFLILGHSYSLAQPANDQCAGAGAMVVGTTYTLNTATATSTGDLIPACQTNFGSGVWYTFTPTATGPVTISTCNSDYDTAIAVYTGGCGALSLLICNDDNGPACTSVQGSVTFDGTAGTTYWILAGGFAGATGNLAILATTPGSVPANDQCSGAIAMTPNTPYNQNTGTATSLGDPVPSCQGEFGLGVWYSFTATTNGTVTISTCGSDFDTVISVYTGTCPSLVPVAGACNDDNGPACDGLQASVSFSATAGTTYYILAGGAVNSSGNLTITASAQAAPPPGFPVITQSPTSKTVCAGQATSFSVVASSTTPLTYQWRLDGNDLGGATANVLSIPNAQSGNAGAYQVVVSNSGGSVTSVVAQLTVNSPPEITTPPTGVTTTPGSTAEFNVVAGGGGPFTYQWFRNGAAIPGGTAATLIIPNVQAASAGSISVRVANSCGSVNSAAVPLTIANRALLLGSAQAAPGDTVEVPVTLVAAGNENRVVFTVLFNDSLVGLSDVFLGDDAQDGTVSTFEIGPGEVQVDIQMPEGENFGSGQREVASLQFSVTGELSDPAVVLLTFGTPTEIFDNEETSLPFQPGNGNIVISGEGVDSPALNSGTGLFEDDLQVAVPPNGLASGRALRVYFLNLGVDSRGRAIQVYNYTGTTGSVPYMQLNGPLAGGVIPIHVQYIVLDRTTVPNPTFAVQELAGSAPTPVLIGDPVPITGENIVFTDGAIYLKFQSLPGRKYYVQYSSDMANWITSFPAVTGTGGSVIWMDNGPPKTESRPNEETSRFYRVFLGQ